MDLLEYQAKELFRQMGIPVLPSQRIDHPKDLKGLKIPYPVVLKSQVYSGGRSKAGGIRFVENTIDAVAAAQTIFHLPIAGQYPTVLLAEAKYESDREFYLAVVLHPSNRRPLLLGSSEGGIEIESVAKHMQQVIVDQEFSPFYARRLALRMGLTGALIQSVSLIVEKMYRLFVQYDLDLVEINPLAVNPSSELMALDGKITVNNDALGRHDDLTALNPEPPDRPKSRMAIAAASGLNLVKLEGAIAVLCNGAGLTMATLDLIHQAGGKPATFLDTGEEYPCRTLDSTLPERIGQGLELVLQDRSVKAILVNILASATLLSQIAMVIANFVQRRTYGNYVPPMVVRLVGNELEQAQAKEILASVEVPLVERMEEAIAQVIAVSKLRKP